MPHRSSIIFGTLFVGGLMLIAWTEYYPSSRMFEALGMPGPRANTGRQCDAVNLSRMLHVLSSRWLHCRGASVSTNDIYFSEGVSVDFVTRRVIGAMRGWTAPDSAHWMNQRDSVARSLVRLGGQPYACVKGKKWFQDGLEPKYWRFSGFYVRLLAHE
jgi:hypothetical protein